MLISVIYTNKQRRKEVRLVPPATHPTDYDKGVLVGPPDLSDLDLANNAITLLNNALVDKGYINLKDLDGNRAELVRMIKDTLDVSEEKARELRLAVLRLYQRESYPDLFEE